jgi:hypothetical protein
VVVQELAEVLGLERRLLEALVFRLLEARGLLVDGEARFLGWAASDIEAAGAAVREVEARRATVVRAMGGDDRATIGTLALQVDEPWTTLLEDHRASLGRLAAEVGAAGEGTHELAQVGLEQLGVTAPASPAPGPAALGDHLGTRWAPPPPGRRRERACSVQQRSGRRVTDLDDLDREITAAGYRAVLGATDRLGLPSLVAFLS